MGVLSGLLMAFASKLEGRMQKRGVYIDDQTIFEKAQESSRQMEIAKWVAMLALGAWQGLSTQV